MFFLSQSPVITIKKDSLLIRNLVFSEKTELLFKKIEVNVDSFLSQHVAKKAFVRDFFLASLVSGHLKTNEQDTILLDIDNGSFVSKRAGVYREDISCIVKRRFQIDQITWAENAKELVGKCSILDNIHLPDGRTSFLTPKSWPKIIKDKQIFVELVWDFQKVFFDECLPYLQEQRKN